MTHTEPNLCIFERELLDRVCYTAHSKEDTTIALQIHKKGEWVLTTELRTKLFAELYVPMLRAYNQNTWEVLHQVSINDRLRLVRGIEEFALCALSIGAKYVAKDTLPPLQDYVDDAIHLLRILKMPAASFSDSLEQTHPF